jgi:hypothetical protein
MPSSNQFKPFAIGGAANTLTPTAWAALTSLLANGFQTGTASSQQINTALRQTTFAVAAIAQAIADTLGVAVNDDGTIANFQAQFLALIQKVGLDSGTKQPFAQAAAPTGWVQDTTDASDNRMLRVVKTAGGGTAGTHSPIVNSVVPAHTHGFTTGYMNSMNIHTHGVTDPTHVHPTGSAQVSAPSGAALAGVGYGSGSTGAASTGISINNVDLNHTHSGSTDNGSSSTNWTPRYIDMIICTKS